MKKKSVLVVDDSRTTRSYVRSVLENDAYLVTEAENGLLAVESIQNKRPDILLIDMLMPEMDGIEVMEKLNELDIKIPTVVLTADIQEQVKEECFELGAKAFLNKPATEIEILETVRNLKL